MSKPVDCKVHILGKEISFIKGKNNNKLAVVFFLTQNMASSQYIQERIKIQKEDGEKKKKKGGCESVFSAFSMKTPINPRGFLTDSFLTPY